jgi:UDP-glucose 4-epimerase
LRENQASLESPEASFADGVYGWTKLIGEYQLENSVQDSKVVGRSARIFTAYGERENESHAAIALISKALLGANPFPIWGNGQQTRNFTYVSDTVTGLLLLGASQKSGKQFESFNIGNSTHTRVIEFVNEIFAQLKVEAPTYKFELDKPMGVASRASQNDKMKEFFNWEPNVDISQGIERTMSWYRKLEDRPQSLAALEERLLAR